MKPDKELQRLDDLISRWQAIVDKYPSEYYKEVLAKAQQDRTDYVNKIGKLCVK